jgi:1-phosphofructokinase family hexose kinase
VILTAGLTPAWQQILVFDGFRYGEVNRAAEVHWCASGKVFNAGIGVHRLGGPSLTLATVGGRFLPEIERDLDAQGVPHRWVVTEAATRVCTTILDRADGHMTELVENGRPLSSAELDAFRAAYREEAARAELVILIGSLPAGTPDTYYRELLEQTPCPAVLDFRGPGLMGLLDLKPYVVKPNREELSRTAGHELTDDRDLVSAMRQLNRRGAQWVVITEGGRPVWVSSQERLYRFHPPRAEKVVNPIGCGDAMAAAIAWSTRKGYPLVEAVRRGVAAAGANLRQLFPCHFDPSLVDELARQVRVEQVD